MLVATKVKISRSEKNVNNNMYGISSLKCVTTCRNFLEVSYCCRAKQQQRNVPKSVMHMQSCSFANSIDLLFFHRSCCLRGKAFTQFYILFERDKYYRQLCF